MDESKRGLVSVIIGLFDVARFLEEKRLRCVLSQTWKDLEIILVNDGSTDSTRQICGELAASDSRIVIVDKPNGGLGSARNAGLDAASGEFVWFYDVDDEVELDLVEKNMRWMREHDADMIIFGNEFIYPETGRVETTCFKERILESNTVLRSVFMDEILLVPNGNGFVWNKFYNREFIERCGARFGEQRIQQDELFNLRLYPFARRVFISPEILYHYNIYNSGNNRSRFIPDRIEIYESIFDGIFEFRDRWSLEDGRLEGYAYRRFYQGIDNSIQFNAFHSDAPAGCKWRRQEVLGILSRPKVEKCLVYIASHNNFNIEGKLFFKAYRSRRFPAISFLRALFSGLRKIKRAVF
ncbi:MAG: glycosyltransferase [Bacteroidales bacterium]|nr:glycosyltransferase [Bacteroidales bacterium]